MHRCLRLKTYGYKNFEDKLDVSIKVDPKVPSCFENTCRGGGFTLHIQMINSVHQMPLFSTKRI